MASAIQRFFRPGQVLFREGAPSNCMYLIKKGTVSVRKVKGSAFVEIARIYANEVLGELSFFDRLPRSASATAMTEVEALEISFESLDKTYVNVPEYLRTIIAAVAERLRKANDMIRRLQRNVVTDDGHEEQLASAKDEAIDVASVLAATAHIGDGTAEKEPMGAREAEPAALAGLLDAQAPSEPEAVKEEEPQPKGAEPAPSDEKKAAG